MSLYAHLPLVKPGAAGAFIKYKMHKSGAFLGVTPNEDKYTPFFRLRNEDAALRYFIENIKNQKLDEAKTILSRGLLFDERLNLEDFFQFIQKDSSYKCLMAKENPAKAQGLRKKSVLIMTKDMPKTIVHVYMKREQDGNWKIYGIERE